MTTKREPAVTIEKLTSHPSLAEYVVKRPTIHEREVIELAELLLAEEQIN